jgi:hypothetical protein
MQQAAMIKPRRDPGMALNHLPDGYVVLFSPDTNLAYTLTPLAALVWEFCDGANTVDEIVAQLGSVDEIPADVDLAKEVHALVNDFVNSGLVFTD